MRALNDVGLFDTTPRQDLKTTELCWVCVVLFINNSDKFSLKSAMLAITMSTCVGFFLYSSPLYCGLDYSYVTKSCFLSLSTVCNPRVFLQFHIIHIGLLLVMQRELMTSLVPNATERYGFLY